MNQQNQTCPCGSTHSYHSCCARFHHGESAKTACDLVRARYSAYVLNLPEYIIRTTHPASPQYQEDHKEWAKKISDFSNNSQFQKLEILSSNEHDTVATVIFVANLTQLGVDASFTEKSYFELIRGQWFYRSGQLVEGTAPSLITTGETRLLPLAYTGNPILRKIAQPVIEITEDIQKLIDEMIETMDACDGIGLAAPQVHHSIRMFVMRVPKKMEGNRLECGDVKVLINPMVSQPSDEEWTASEGCLSVPTIHEDVVRPQSVTVEYMNRCGEMINERVSGWEARVIMHENDHLNGVLFVDRLDKEQKKEIAPFLKRLNRRIHDGTEL